MVAPNTTKGNASCWGLIHCTDRLNLHVNIIGIWTFSQSLLAADRAHWKCVWVGRTDKGEQGEGSLGIFVATINSFLKQQKPNAFECVCVFTVRKKQTKLKQYQVVLMNIRNSVVLGFHKVGGFYSFSLMGCLEHIENCWDVNFCAEKISEGRSMFGAFTAEVSLCL